MNATPAPRALPYALLALRLGVAVVFVMWTVDKFLNPDHAARVFEHFYLIPGLGEIALYALGGLQGLIVLAFLFGAWKRFSYAAVFVMHAVSTASSYPRYLDPWTAPNLLFFAAFPMLAACLALWLLREHDTLLAVGR